MQATDLVFQYFFAVGAGLGVGLVLTIGSAIVIYKGVKRKWFS